MREELLTQLQVLSTTNRVLYDLRQDRNVQKVALCKELCTLKLASYQGETGPGGSLKIYAITEAGFEALAQHLGKTVAEIRPKTLAQLAAETEMNESCWQFLMQIAEKGSRSFHHAAPDQVNPHQDSIHRQVLVHKGYARIQVSIVRELPNYLFEITDAGREALAKHQK
jgi:DNA-binding PadR family transcriptional regulator